jgi:hypothetical protein
MCGKLQGQKHGAHDLMERIRLRVERLSDSQKCVGELTLARDSKRPLSIRLLTEIRNQTSQKNIEMKDRQVQDVIQYC